MGSAAVVGSGPNGLTGAIRLARAGLDVTVVEADELPGGGARTSELTLPGVLHDDCSAFHPGAIASPYFRELELERHGLRWLWPEVDLAHPLDDGRVALAARDMRITLDSLGDDGARWARLHGPVVRHFDALVSDTFGPLTNRPHDPLALARFGIDALQPATWIARRFDHAEPKALFMGLAAHKFGRLDTPLSGAVGLMLAATTHAGGWPVAEGGSVAITNALVAELEAHGGRVVTGQRVTSLDSLARIIGERPQTVLLDTSPTSALAILGSQVPRRIRLAFKHYAYGPAAYKVDLAIEGDIPWRNPDCLRAGTVHLGGSAEQIASAEAATAGGRMPARPFVLLGQQYLIDPSRSSSEANPIYAYAHVPHAYGGDASETVIAQIERFAPGFRQRIRAINVRGPAALQRYNANYLGGDISAGANTARQLLMRPRPTLRPYQLGVPGVYLCSSATPPGAGVHGMCGFHAAGAALKRL